MTTIPAEKLDKLVSRWETVQGTLARGADQETYVQLSREFAELDPIVATIDALRSTRGISNDRRKLSGLTAIPLRVLEETASSCCK